MSELFETNLEKASDSSRRSRWLLIAALAIVILGGIIAWQKFGPQPTLYESEIGRLKPGMTDLEIFDAIGAPYHVDNVVDGKISIYGVPGATQRLLVRTTNQHYETGAADTILGWCVLALRTGKPKSSSGPAPVEEDKTVGTDSYYESIKCKDLENPNADATNEP